MEMIDRFMVLGYIVIAVGCFTVIHMRGDAAMSRCELERSHDVCFQTLNR